MGFFSWNCCGCDKPVINIYINQGYEWASDVVLLNKNGSSFTGSYNGYGRINAPYFDVDDSIANRDFNGEGVRWYHRRCFTNQTWAETKKASSDWGQGFFYNDADLQRIFGQPQGVTR